MDGSHYFKFPERSDMHATESPASYEERFRLLQNLYDELQSQAEMWRVADDRARSAFSDALVVMQEHGLDGEVRILRERWTDVEILDYGISTHTPETKEEKHERT